MMGLCPVVNPVYWGSVSPILLKLTIPCERLFSETSVDVASAAVDESMLQARTVLESTAWGDLRVWHRNWIVLGRRSWRFDKRCFRN